MRHSCLQSLTEKTPSRRVLHRAQSPRTTSGKGRKETTKSQIFQPPPPPLTHSPPNQYCRVCNAQNKTKQHNEGHLTKTANTHVEATSQSDTYTQAPFTFVVDRFSTTCFFIFLFFYVVALFRFFSASLPGRGCCPKRPPR